MARTPLARKVLPHTQLSQFSPNLKEKETHWAKQPRLPAELCAS